MEKRGETQKGVFCYVHWESEKRIFAQEAQRYRLIQGIGQAAQQRGCKVSAFTVLEDSVHILLHTDRQQRSPGGYAVGNLLRESESYMPNTKTQNKNGYSRSEPSSSQHSGDESLLVFPEMALKEHDSGWSIQGGVEVLRFCSDIHLLPLRQGYVLDLNDYWFSSWQSYRNHYKWEWLDMEPVLHLLAKNKETAMELFQTYQKRQLLQMNEGGQRS